MMHESSLCKALISDAYMHHTDPLGMMTYSIHVVKIINCINFTHHPFEVVGTCSGQSEAEIQKPDSE